MTSVSVPNLQKQVRVTLDNNASSEALASLKDVDTLTLDELIEQCLEPAARIVEVGAPYHLLDRGEPFSGTIYWPDAVGVGSGHIHLPDDFLRLATFRMSDWKRTVTTAIGPDDALYERQSSPFAGVRGNPERPVVAIVPWSTGLELEFYSCTAGSGVHVRRARYIPIPKISGEGDARVINVCEKLVPAVVYYAAGLVATSVVSKDFADMLFQQAKNLMQ